MSPSIAVAADADEQPVRFRRRRRRLSLLAPRRRPPCQCHPSIPVVPKEAAVALAAAVTLPLPPDDRNRARSFTTGSVNPPAGMALGGKINQRHHHDNANFGDTET